MVTMANQHNNDNYHAKKHYYIRSRHIKKKKLMKLHMYFEKKANLSVNGNIIYRLASWELTSQ